MTMKDWHVFTHPTIQLRFRYPAVTPLGHAVEVTEQQSGESSRAHLVSRPAQEVYFEVSRYDGLSASEEYERHRSYLLHRFAGEPFTVSDLQETRLRGLPASQYNLEWSDRQRVVILVQRRQALYRVIYDPRAPLNIQILGTLEFLE